MNAAKWSVFTVGVVCLAAAYLMFGLEFSRADAELRPGSGITWPEWTLAALGLTCIATSIVIRRKANGQRAQR